MEAFVLVLTAAVVNGVMALAKRLGAEDFSSYGKRGLLAFLSLIGVVSMSSLTGALPDAQLTENLATTLVTSLATFLMAHANYSLASGK